MLSAVSWLQQTTAAGSQIVRQLDFTAGESCSGFVVTTTQHRTKTAQMYATHMCGKTKGKLVTSYQKDSV
jgi:hypothetical protein